MIDPRDIRRRGEEHLKLRVPDRALQRQQTRLKCAEPIGVKIDMLGFVLQDQRASFVEHRIARARLQESIVRSPDYFSYNEQLNFEFESKPMPHQSEE